MTVVDYAPPRQRLSWFRRIVGTIVCVVGLLLAAGYAINRVTRTSVVLRSHFENFLTGIGLLLVFIVLALIVLTPVRNSAAQGRRMMLRFIICAVAALVFVGAGLTHGFNFFRYSPSIIATSPDGTRQLALVDVGGYKQLHVYTGRGLGAQLAGNLGGPCEFDHANFVGNSEITVATGLGDYHIKLAPDGHPESALPHQCNGSFQAAPAVTATPAT
jgi:hypothetical protein